MKFIETNTYSGQNVYFNKTYHKEQLLFFDIETTGFSPASTSLYLIGCMYYRDDSWRILQWFNDDGCSEQAMLSSFLLFAKDYPVLIHFNGDGFDLPYMRQKCESYGIPYNISHMESIDLYKWIRPYKRLLDLPNLKLKTLESFLHIERCDAYSGGELIKVYDKYLHTQAQDLFSLLYQHNYEDIKNMLDTCDILYYKDLFDTIPEHVAHTATLDMLTLSFHTQLPRKFSQHKHRVSLKADCEMVALSIPVMSGELKYFFEDYKHYYYLPVEDTAIHQSIASYMDKNYRKKATRNTCYQKITGQFLPTFGYTTEKTFGFDYKTRNDYMELSIIETPDMNLSMYAFCILQWF